MGFVSAPEPILGDMEPADSDGELLMAPQPAVNAPGPGPLPVLPPLGLPASGGGGELPQRGGVRVRPAPPMQPPGPPADEHLGTIAIVVLTISALAAASIAALLYVFLCHRRLIRPKSPPPRPPPPAIVVGDAAVLEAAATPNVRASLPSPAPSARHSKFATPPWLLDVPTPDSKPYHHRDSPPFYGDARESVDSGGLLPARYRRAAKAASRSALTPTERASSNNWRARGDKPDPSEKGFTIFMQSSETSVASGLYALGPADTGDLKTAAGRASDADTHLTTHAARHVAVIPVETPGRGLSGSAGASAVLTPVELLEKQLDWLDAARGGLMFDRYRCVFCHGLGRVG